MDQIEYDLLSSSLNSADDIKKNLNKANKSLKKLSATENIKQIEDLIAHGWLDQLSVNFIASLVHSLEVEIDKVVKDLEKQFSDL